MANLKGKIAFVTGSGRGLGRAMAERLAEAGADVAIHDISQQAPAEFGEAKNLDEVATHRPPVQRVEVAAVSVPRRRRVEPDHEVVDVGRHRGWDTRVDCARPQHAAERRRRRGGAQKSAAIDRKLHVDDPPGFGFQGR